MVLLKTSGCVNYLRISFKKSFYKIVQLRKLLENMESTTEDIMKKYEKEINTLQSQVRIEYLTE